MATLTAAEKTLIRQMVAAGANGAYSVNYTKAQIDAAAQAVEDFLTNNAAAISTAVNTATAPVTFSAAQKKAIGAWVVFCKYQRDKQ